MNLPQRKLQRLKNYDYSQNGAYFITICTHNHLCLFGEIKNGIMILNEHGNVAKEFVESIPERWSDVFITKYVIMPNHVHMIVEIMGDGQPQGLSLQTIISALKSLITIEILSTYKAKNQFMGKIFQRSYHDHIIRNEAEYRRICEYIDTNPLKWELDKYFI